jgi:hypothetical protein
MREKLEALAHLIADFREGEIEKPDAEHVNRWVSQFDSDAQEPILEELCHVWSALYLSQAKARRRIRRMIGSDGLGGANPAGYWSQTGILQVQEQGKSQGAMLRLFDEELGRIAGISLSDCNGANRFIYADDVLFTGFTLGNEIEEWLAKAPDKAHLEVFLFGLHTFGREKAEERLNRSIAASGKKISFSFYKDAVQFENRLQHRTFADVLWPESLPAEAEGFDQGEYPFKRRTPVNRTRIFSSDARRNVLEQALLKAGLKICRLSDNPVPSLRPLGFGPFAMGFGSLVLTWRNCPNNAPLALWWGDPSKPDWHPLSKWYPLVPRKP